MDFNTFLSKIKTIKQAKLGGLNAQLKMTPPERKNLDANKIAAYISRSKKVTKEAAVLILIYPNKDNEACFLLTKRANYNGTHSAQISFPGGKKDVDDISFKETALRETFEEVNVNTTNVNIIKTLTATYIPPSNFWVYPFIGISKTTPSFKKNYEVETLIEVKLSQLLDDEYVTKKWLETKYMKKVEMPCFLFDNQIVWGATAMILNEVKILLKNIFDK